MRFIKRFLLLMILFPNIILAEDIFFKVAETTPVWENINFPTLSNISGEIPEKSIVKGDMGVRFSDLQSVLENIPLQKIIYNNKQMLIYANSLIPMETQDFFEKDILYNPEKTLISFAYVNAFHPNNREIIYLQNKSAWNDYIARVKDEYQNYYEEETDEWWSYLGGPDKLIITQTALTFGSNVKNDSHLLIKNIKKTEDGYRLTVKESTAFQPVNKWWGWPRPEERELFTVLLIPDGDYIDLFLENKNALYRYFCFCE